MEEAWEAFVEGDYRRAENLLSRLLKEDPENVEAHYLRARSYAQFVKAFRPAIEYQSAESDFEWVLARDSSYRDVLYQYALLNRYDERFERAIELTHAQLRYHPELEEAHHGLFQFYRLYVSITKPEKALAYLSAHPSYYAEYVRSEVLRRQGKLNEAEAVLTGLARRPLPIPSQPVILSLARVAYAKGEPEAAERYVWMAVDRIGSRLDADLVMDDVKYIVSEEEWAEYQAISDVAGWKEFFRTFWAKRDPIPSDPVNWRLAEHYRRLAVAERDHVWIGTRDWHTTPDTLGILQFPGTFDLNGEFTDKGIVYIRHGEPDEKITSVTVGGIEAIDSWRYNNPPMSFHFSFVRHWRFVPVPQRPEVFGDLSHWGREYADLAVLADRQLKYQAIRGMFGVDRNVVDVDREGRERHHIEYRLSERIREWVAEALVTDRHTWPDSITAMPIPHVLAAFRGTDGRTDLDVHFALPSGFVSEELDRDTGSLPVEVGLSVQDGAFRTAAEQADTLTMRMSRDESDALLSAFRVSLPPDSYRVALHARPVGTHLLGGYVNEVDVPDFSAPGLAMSDVLPAFSVRERTVPPRNRADMQIRVNPSGRFATTEGVDLYFEVYNLRPGAGGRTRYAVEYVLTPEDPSMLERVIGKGKRASLTLKTEHEGAGETTVEYAEIDVADVEPGRYVLTVRVTDAEAGASVERPVAVELVE